MFRLLTSLRNGDKERVADQHGNEAIQNRGGEQDGKKTKFQTLCSFAIKKTFKFLFFFFLIGKPHL